MSSIKIEDHPRSRGVYKIRYVCPRPRAGSSPLARGLLDHQQVLVGDGGIIPARAGFTSAPTSAGRRRRDHPRSRGVYPPATRTTTVVTG